MGRATPYLTEDELATLLLGSLAAIERDDIEGLALLLRPLPYLQLLQVTGSAMRCLNALLRETAITAELDYADWLRDRIFEAAGDDS